MSGHLLLEPLVVDTRSHAGYRPSRPLEAIGRRALPAVALLVAFNVAVCAPGLAAARFVSITFLLVVPGALLLGAAAVRPTSGFVRLVYAVASSVLVLLAIALVESVALPPLGIARPLTLGPLLIGVDAATVVLLALAARRVDPVAALLGDHAPSARSVGVVLWTAGLVLVAAAGAERLNAGAGSAVAIVAVVAAGCSVVGVILAGDRVPAWVQAAVLWSVAVALMFAYSLRGNRVFGFDIQEEMGVFAATLKAGVWRVPTDHNAYSAMLSITALPAALSRLTGISGTYLFKLVYPVVFGLFPVLSFQIAARFVARTPAFVAVAFTVVTASFSQEIPGLARQEIGLLFFAVAVSVAFDRELPRRTRQIGVCLAGAGMAVTHYSTAYATLFAVGTGYLIYAGLRASSRLRGRRQAREVVLTLPVVGVLAAVVWGWNVGITHSASNVSNFVTQASALGPDLLPNSKGGSLIGRWVNGMNPRPLTAANYYQKVSAQYAGIHPWINRYPAAVTNRYPAVSAKVPAWPARVAGVAKLSVLASPVAAETFLIATVVGLLAFAWTRRRDERAGQLEFAAVGLGFLAFVAFVRVSGAAIETYNPERAQIHASVLLSVGLATSLAWLFERRRRLVRAVMPVAAAGLIAIVFFTGSGSGLSAVIGGGNPTANLASKGEDYERFYETDQDVAAAQWLVANRDPTALIWADRYGALQLRAVLPKEVVPFDGLTPSTVDLHAYVFATSTNIADGRARGAIDGATDGVVYAFPGSFLDANKAVVYSTATTRIYK